MKKHTNFYETIEEAKIRLDQTVVLYDNEPYHLLCVTNHKSDGIFRVYLDPVVDDGNTFHRNYSVPYEWYDEPGQSRGARMDKFMDEMGDKNVILRKMMNSPKFNSFRPFPLGMCNNQGGATYVERTPARHTQQGLTGNMMLSRPITLDGGKNPAGAFNSRNIGVYSNGFRSCILGQYPNADECLTNLTDKAVANQSVAFHREFAFVKGPVGIMFVAYKGDVVGFLPNRNLTEVKICDEFNYVREVVDELAMFSRIS